MAYTLFKIVVVGPKCSGKSCLVQNFADDTFDENTISTIGMDFRTRSVQMHGEIVRLQLWDTAGLDTRFGCSSRFSRGGEGALYVFDLTSNESLSTLRDCFPCPFHKENAVLTLVGNKSDLINDRVVSFEEANEFAMKNGMAYYETSAKQSENVEEAFMHVVSELYERKILNPQHYAITLQVPSTRSMGGPLEQCMC